DVVRRSDGGERDRVGRAVLHLLRRRGGARLGGDRRGGGRAHPRPAFDAGGLRNPVAGHRRVEGRAAGVGVVRVPAHRVAAADGGRGAGGHLGGDARDRVRRGARDGDRGAAGVG